MQGKRIKKWKEDAQHAATKNNRARLIVRGGLRTDRPTFTEFGQHTLTPALSPSEARQCG